MTLTLLFALLWACGGHEEADHDEAGHADASESHADAVQLTPEAVLTARIAVAPATRSALVRELKLPSRIQLDPRREAIVGAWIGGQVDQIDVRAGDSVRAGQVLATVQSPDLGEAIAAYRAAVSRDEAADARLERLQRLETQGVAARAQVLEAEADHAEAEGGLEAAEERLRILGVDPSKGDPHSGEHYASHVPVRSPIAGRVLTTDASIGRRVSPGDALFHVGDLSEVWLLIDVYERDLHRVAEGQTVRFSVDAWPNQRFEGTVSQVGDWVEPESRSVEVRVVVPNPDAKLKPNMFATATLSLTEEVAEEGVVLPVDAVREVDGHEVVFIQEAEGRFVPRRVTVAERGSDRLRLESGVEAGEPVVTEGAFTLAAELEKSELGGGHAH
ncbi:MAG: efflux RND transporter periplasmic adaptor subunit [Alphaproteobacteria bacterium]|nr:efflux RND transporter periplasmic adaptor subunit [Alphaproteobacteria bacterium]